LEKRTTGYLERVVWNRRYWKTGPQEIKSKWSGKEGIGKADHRIFGASGPEKKVLEKRTTGNQK